MTRAILAVMAALTLPIGVARAQQPIPIKAGVTVAPDTVRIGDPFRITVGVRAPKGATIDFPRATDSTSTVQSLDPVNSLGPEGVAAVVPKVPVKRVGQPEDIAHLYCYLASEEAGYVSGQLIVADGARSLAGLD